MKELRLEGQATPHGQNASGGRRQDTKGLQTPPRSSGFTVLSPQRQTGTRPPHQPLTFYKLLIMLCSTISLTPENLLLHPRSNPPRVLYEISSQHSQF